MAKKNDLTDAQYAALGLAVEHGSIVIAKGFGRDKATPNAVTTRVWARLVIRGLTTPRRDRKPFTGVAFSVDSGRPAWLTEAGRLRHVAGRDGKDVPPLPVTTPAVEALPGFVELGDHDKGELRKFETFLRKRGEPGVTPEAAHEAVYGSTDKPETP